MRHARLPLTQGRIMMIKPAPSSPSPPIILLPPDPLSSPNSSHRGLLAKLLSHTKCAPTLVSTFTTLSPWSVFSPDLPTAHSSLVSSLCSSTTSWQRFPDDTVEHGTPHPALPGHSTALPCLMFSIHSPSCYLKCQCVCIHLLVCCVSSSALGI